MRRREFDRLVRRHLDLPLHRGWASCACSLAQRIRAEHPEQQDLLVRDLRRVVRDFRRSLGFA